MLGHFSGLNSYITSGFGTSFLSPMVFALKYGKIHITFPKSSKETFASRRRALLTHALTFKDSTVLKIIVRYVCHTLDVGFMD